MKNKLKILVADDHGIVREGIVSLIRTQPDMEVIGQASDGATMLQEAQDCMPDVVIVDVSMPHMNGIQATAQLCKACPGINVVALTRYGDSGHARQMLQAGAHGYVLKQAAAQDLIIAIRTVAAGGVYLDTTLAGRILDVGTRAPGTSDAAPQQPLSQREEEVLRLLAFGHSNKEIAGQLDISVKTIETYKARAMEKLQLHSRTALVRYALEQNWFEAN